MPNGKRLAAIAVALIVIVLAILLALFFRPGPSTVPSTEAPAAPSAAAPVTTFVPESLPVPTGAVAVQTLARIFAERYSSYSTEADFANLRDTLPLMTSAFAAKTETYMRTAGAPTAFYGVTTRAVAVKTDSFDDNAGVAAATVSTQREETTGTAAPVVKYQDLALTFEKVGGEWKIASAVWR